MLCPGEEERERSYLAITTLPVKPSPPSSLHILPPSSFGRRPRIPPGFCFLLLLLPPTHIYPSSQGDACPSVPPSHPRSVTSTEKNGKPCP